MTEVTHLLTDLAAWERGVATKANERAQFSDAQNTAEAHAECAVLEAAVSGLRRPAGEDFFKYSKGLLGYL